MRETQNNILMYKNKNNPMREKEKVYMNVEENNVRDLSA